MNNSYQFFHLETYADKPRKGSGRPSAEAVARECQRLEQSFPHINQAQPAETLFGIEPLQALERVRKLVKQCRDPLGRKIRADAQIISFGVASINVESTPENWEKPEVKRWVSDTLTFLKREFGEAFVSLQKHSDERLCHLHFTLIPNLSDGGLNISSIHPGLAAQRATKSKSKSIKDRAYKDAMRDLQDSYFEHVGVKNGQLRYGPRRRRLSRHEWHAQKRYAQLITGIFHERDSLIKELGSKLEKAKIILAKVFPSFGNGSNMKNTNCQEKSL